MAEADEIYDFIARQGTPSTLPGAWKQLPCHPGFFDLSGEPAARLACLQSAFAVDELAKARVVQVDDRGNAKLNPRLARDSSWVLAVRKKADAKPFDLLVGGCGIAGRYFPWNAVQADYRVQLMMESCGKQLMVAMSPEDMAVLWSLGIPATSHAWLKDIGGKPLSSLCKAFGFSSTMVSEADGDVFGSPARKLGVEQHANAEGISLVLANWSVSALERTTIPAVAEIVAHFRKLHRFLGLEMEDFGVWTPSEEDIECLKFCVRYGEPDGISNAIVERLEAYCESIIETPGVVRRVPGTTSEAVAAWVSTFAGPPDERRRKVAWDDVRQMQENELVEPLVRLGQEVRDPIRRNMINTLASISRVLHPQALAVATKFAIALRDRGMTGLAVLPIEELQQLLILTDRTIALTQELQPWRTKKKIKLTSLPVPTRPSTSTKSSDSAAKKSPTSGIKGS